MKLFLAGCSSSCRRAVCWLPWVLLFSAACSLAQAQRFQVVGRVTDGETGAPMNRTWLGLYSSERLLAQGWTDLEGDYELPPIEEEPGAYRLEV